MSKKTFRQKRRRTKRNKTRRRRMSRRNLRGGGKWTSASYNKEQENTGATKATGSSFANRARLSDTPYKKFSTRLSPEDRENFSAALKAAEPAREEGAKRFERGLAEKRLVNEDYIDDDQLKADTIAGIDAGVDAKKDRTDALFNEYLLKK